MFPHIAYFVVLASIFPRVCWAGDIVSRDAWKAMGAIERRSEAEAAKWRQAQIRFLLKQGAIKSESEVQDNIEYTMPRRKSANYLTLHATDEDFAGLTAKQRLRNYQEKMQHGYSIDRTKYHLFALPGDLPYHYLVLKDGTVAEGRKLKHGPFSNTTYRTDMASHITVVLEGKFGDKGADLKGVQRRALIGLLARLVKEHKINVDNFSFHKKVAKEYTTCPGSRVIADFENIRAEVRTALKR